MFGTHKLLIVKDCATVADGRQGWQLVAHPDKQGSAT